MAEACDGHLSSAGVKAVEFLTGTKELWPGDNGQPEMALPKVADALSIDYVQVGIDPLSKTACSITGPRDVHLRVSFTTTTDYSEDDPYADTLTKYDVGRGALVGIPRGYLYFNCASSQFYEGTKQPAVLLARIDNYGAALPGAYHPKGGPEKVRAANLTVLQSLSLSMAKQLGCADDGGLKAKLTIKPVART